MPEKPRHKGAKPEEEQSSSLASDFVLPMCEEPLKEHGPLRMSWSEAMRHFAPTREYYMRHFDSPEKRFRDKNPEPFRMP